MNGRLGLGRVAALPYRGTMKEHYCSADAMSTLFKILSNMLC